MKNMTKKLLCVLLTTFMLITSLAGLASASTEGYEFTYDLRTTDTTMGVTQDTDDAVGHRFKVNTSFTAAGMQVAIWENGGVVESVRQTR